MGYAIAALVIAALVVLNKKKKPGRSVYLDPAEPPTRANANGYQAFDPGPGMGPVYDPPPQFDPGPQQDPAGLTWDDFERVPNVVLQSAAPNFFKVTDGMTGRIYKHQAPDGTWHWQTAVFKSFIRVWPAGAPTGYALPGEALAAGVAAKAALAS